MKLHALALTSLLLAACAPPVHQGPIQQPVPIPRGSGDRSRLPPPRSEQPPPPAAEPARPEARPAPDAPQPAAVAAPADRLEHPELLDAVLWVQTSAEYQAAALQAYRSARENLERALAEPGWTAFGGSTEPAAAERPPAIVLDVDETVLDNSAYESRLILGEEGSFTDWCREEKAEAVPGALDFLRYADSRGVAVFYVTNRNHEVEEPTRRNLEKLGFPLGPAGEDRLLTRYERSEWTSDKESRRAQVARSHRVVLLLGDDLNDFISGARSGLEQRRELLQASRGRWGREWILLPNPMYGSWERALTFGREELTPAEELQLKQEALERAE